MHGYQAINCITLKLQLSEFLLAHFKHNAPLKCKIVPEISKNTFIYKKQSYMPFSQ